MDTNQNTYVKPAIPKDETILSIKDLTTYYITREMGTCKAVNNVSLEIKAGETLGLVGETGAGKTTIALSILRLLQSPPAKIMNGEILWRGENILEMSETQMQKLRGEQISMVFQDPMTALNPIDPVGDQIAEVIFLHQEVSKAESKKRAAEMLEVVGIPKERFGEYPHQFSGGMKQRVVIAMALACNPVLLLADEPTTALDVTIQAQVLDMIQKLKDQLGTSVILITHDLGVVANFCNSVAVVYAGEIIEYGTVEQVFDNPKHPYTIGLFASLPKLSSTEPRLKSIKGLMPNMQELTPGCKFCERCDYAMEGCSKQKPEITEIEPGHIVKCFLVERGE